jgi:hypothetical protein
MSEKFLWWCYLHTNGYIQAKRYFDDRDLEDADESPFVQERSQPFEAEDRDDAIKQYHDSLVARHVAHELTKKYEGRTFKDRLES